MKINLLLLCLGVLLIESSSGQEEEYPFATPTDQPDVVISPYDSSRRLDVAGLKEGSLAKDPVAGKVFRLPYSNPAKKIFDKPAESSPSARMSERGIVPGTSEFAGDDLGASQLPPDLLNFIYAFNQNSTVNDPDALVPFYADKVDNYFGRKNVSKASIRADRASYINRFPQREYILDGPPVLNGVDRNIYEVTTRVKYIVEGGGRVKTGTVSDRFKIRRGARSFEIVSIDEAKVSSAPVARPQVEDRNIELSGIGNGMVYRQFELDQIQLFLEAFASSGEVNNPSAMVDFIHPQAVSYYTLANPEPEELLDDRRSFISLWPERRYWLAEKPDIRSLGSGSWKVIVKMGYELNSGSKSAKGVSVTDMRVTHTASGMKIVSISRRN